MERRLAAILIADVVGYARHSRTDEERTRERFNADLHDLIEPTIASHSGRLVKTMGDGILAEFKSVVDATRCAIEWQTKKSQNNSTDALVFRIGINIGDIIIEPPDIHGDGVNLAARLQTLANPGGIALSGPAYDQVQSKISTRFHYIGPRTVKSIPDPVRVYLIDVLPADRRKTMPRIHARHLVAAASLASALLIGSAVWYGLGSRSEAPDGGASSMAVLPFANMSDDTQQGHLADGITEDLTTELAQVPGLFITSRSAAFAYRDKNVSPQKIAQTLGVHYVLEGSVRRMGNELRVTAQLIDAETNGHIWANRYDGTWDDVFTVQDKIVSEIAGTLRLKLAAARQGAAMAGGTRNPAAYEAYLKGKSLLKSSNPGDWQSAVDAYKEALNLDANFGAAAAEIAWIYHDATGSRLSALGLDLAEARELEANYLANAQQHPSAAYHQLKSDQLVAAQQSDEAITSAQAAIDLDPSDPLSYHAMAFALILNGQAENGLGYVKRATRLDPKWSSWRHFLQGFGLFMNGQREAAAIELEKARSSQDDFDAWSRYLGNQLLLSIYGTSGQSSLAASIRAELDVQSQNEGARAYTRLLAMNEFPFKSYADTQVLLSGLEKAGVPELPFDLDPTSPSRLRGYAIRAAFFGHELTGTQLETNEDVVRRTGLDGRASVTVGAWHGEGLSQIEGDAICSWFPTSPRNCYAVFSENAAAPNSVTYLYVRPSARFRLHVAE